MTARAAAVLLVAALALGAALDAQERARVEAPGRAILIDRPRHEGEPCRPEFLLPPDAVPPGAVPHVSDVCVVKTAARQTAYRRSR